ncbi:zona pellucida sperm-binding protein 2-like [Lepisosteus oculatus]|uniref:zona pellucida sperm-binding protein 2-like n=1 Tax=Lepisosteus oculatus TaxID=7918 RepID=UPI0035F51E82
MGWCDMLSPSSSLILRLMAMYVLASAQTGPGSVIPIEVDNTNCGKTYMEALVPQIFPDFGRAMMKGPQWSFVVNDGGEQISMALDQASENGYELRKVDGKLVIRAYFTAKGLQIFEKPLKTQSLYLADLQLKNDLSSVAILIHVVMICVPDPVVCSKTELVIHIPKFTGSLVRMTVGTRTYLPSRHYPDLEIQQGFDETRISVLFSSPLVEEKYCEDVHNASSRQNALPETKMTFDVRGAEFSMTIEPVCQCNMVPLCKDGYMDVDVSAGSTVPVLNLSTVQLRDPSCRPAGVSAGGLQYRIPLDSCGTTVKMLNGQLVYENEIVAVKRIQGGITRDAEFRLTVVCYFNGSADPLLTIQMNTKAPPPPVLEQGEIQVVLLAYPDVQYSRPYGTQDYPILKYLQEPLYLEVQVLNRQDPNIKLALNDCWATASPDPSTAPRWDVIVDGCEYEEDNYKTVQHPMSRFPTVQFLNHYRRFEVKMFTFVSEGNQLTDSVYFHCSTLICASQRPDSALCSRSCPSGFQGRRRRGLRDQSSPFVSEVLMSLPGPVTVQNALH